MGYLSFDREEVVNLNLSLRCEYLRTNRAGSYASSTIIGCNTRKYHGLLVCPLPAVGDSKYVLLSALHETVIQHQQEFNLGINKYPNEFSPLGHKYIRNFDADPIPSTLYGVGGVVLKKELLLVEEDERILIKYTLEEAHSATRLRLRPFLAFRSVHELTHANVAANTRYEAIDNGIKLRLYEPYPYLHIQFSKEPDYVHAPDWHYAVEYEKERERGFEYHEDLCVPGYFEFDIKKGESILFSAGLQEIDSGSLKRKFTAETAKRTPRNSFENCLENAAQQFISRRGKKTEIIASFPWSGNWGRDSLIALPGLTLVRNDSKTAKQVLDTMASSISGMTFCNRGNIEHANVDSVDTALWFFWAVQQYAYFTQDWDGVKTDFAKKLEQILKSYKTGNDLMSLHKNGLLHIDTRSKAVTWMDTYHNDRPVVGRRGYVVEINALWYNALQFYKELCSKTDLKLAASWSEIIADIEKSYVTTFWRQSTGYLADFVVDDAQNLDVRPNMLFACSLPYSLLSTEQKKSVLDVIKNNLLTPRGLRSLSPNSFAYRSTCEGTVWERDLAYHQGTVWPWLLGSFAEAWLQIHQKSGISMIKNLYEGFETEMRNHGIGSISEVYDGNPPHQARGSISQAWNVAEILRMKWLIGKVENK